MNSKNIRAIIIECCEKDRKCVDSDKRLIAKVWNKYGWKKSRTLYQNLRLVPSAETIRRTRQKLVEEGKIKPSIDATERRYRAFKETRKKLGYKV